VNKKSRVAQMKHRRRKETLKERAKAANPAARAAAPVRTKYEIEETPAAAAIKASKPKAAAPKKIAEAKPEVEEAAAEVKTKAAAKPKTEAPAAEAKQKTTKLKPEAAAEDKPKGAKPKANKAPPTE
jgi:hypothetical protein